MMIIIIIKRWVKDGPEPAPTFSDWGAWSPKSQTSVYIACWYFPIRCAGVCFGSPTPVSLPSQTVSAAWLPIKMRKEVIPPLLLCTQGTYMERRVLQNDLHIHWKLQSEGVRRSDSSSCRTFSGRPVDCVILAGHSAVTLIGYSHWIEVSLLSIALFARELASPTRRKSTTFLTTQNLCLVSVQEARRPATLSMGMTHCPPVIHFGTIICHRCNIPSFPANCEKCLPFFGKAFFLLWIFSRWQYFLIVFHF